ncbi:hypothetical protein BJ742DRAFT_779547 [Cladochytrium replicatum]|nr:hypothetical protein BJ742DRAFT_779547 [Cladochytrium replicatum]
MSTLTVIHHSEDVVEFVVAKSLGHSLPQAAITCCFGSLMVYFLTVDPTYAVFANIIILLAICWTSTNKESFLAIKGVGLQLKSISTIGLQKSSKFLPHADVLDLVVTEFLHRFTIKTCLAVIVRGQENAELVFGETMPNLSIVQQVYSHAYKLMYQAPGPEGETELK